MVQLGLSVLGREEDLGELLDLRPVVDLPAVQLSLQFIQLAGSAVSPIRVRS